MYPKPLKGVPADTELLTLPEDDAAGFCGSSEGVAEAENGCAAEVEVAAGGPSWLFEGGPRDALTGSADKGYEVENSRRDGRREECRRRMHW